MYGIYLVGMGSSAGLEGVSGGVFGGSWCVDEGRTPNGPNGQTGQSVNIPQRKQTEKHCIPDI